MEGFFLSLYYVGDQRCGIRYGEREREGHFWCGLKIVRGGPGMGCVGVVWGRTYLSSEG